MNDLALQNEFACHYAAILIAYLAVYCKRAKGRGIVNADLVSEDLVLHHQSAQGVVLLHFFDARYGGNDHKGTAYDCY